MAKGKKDIFIKKFSEMLKGMKINSDKIEITNLKASSLLDDLENLIVEKGQSKNGRNA